MIPSLECKDGLIKVFTYFYTKENVSLLVIFCADRTFISAKQVITRISFFADLTALLKHGFSYNFFCRNPAACPCVLKIKTTGYSIHI